MEGGLKKRNMVIARGLAVLLLTAVSSRGGEIVIGIVEAEGGAASSWERVCVANGFAKVAAQWSGGSVVAKSSATNALILLSSRSLGILRHLRRS